MKKIVILIRFFIYLTPLFFYVNVMAYDENAYKVVKKTDIYEIRYYPERFVAQTTYSKGESGFQKLFRYITGSNRSTQKINMTTPVTEEVINNKMVMQFFLPTGYTLENAPTPNDPNIIITTIKEGYYAVIQYSGRHTDKRFIKHKKILYQALVEDGITMNEIPIKASYNDPYTLPILRRNETMFSIDWKE